DDEFSLVDARGWRNDVRHVARMGAVGVEKAVLLSARVEVRAGTPEAWRDAHPDRVEMDAVRADPEAGDADRHEKSSGRVRERCRADGRVRDVVHEGPGRTNEF